MNNADTSVPMGGETAVQPRQRAPRSGPEQRDDTALAVAVEHGFAAVTVPAIAEQMNVTRPVVYAYFPDRVDSIEALIQREDNFLIDGVLEVLPRRAVDARHYDGMQTSGPARGAVMAFYRQVGAVPPKRHTQHRDDQGRLYYEELMGAEGFSGDSALLYHRGLPPAIVDSTVWELPDQTLTPNHPLRHRHLRLHQLFPGDTPAGTDPVTGRRLLLGNADVRISYVVAKGASPLYRNAIGDELVYVESGAAVVETVFGTIAVRRGDQLLVPRATTHRWLPSGPEPLRAYVIEASSHITPPKRYLSKFGQLLEHSPYCERDLHGPREPLIATGTDIEVLVKHRPGGQVVGTRMIYATHPFDVVGWDGCLYPLTFNIADFEPLTGRVHQPPPAHQAFEGINFVVCNFVPRKVDYHPLSIPVPYYHSNVDSDEIMFYCGGNYEARRGSGIGPGSVSVHPGGYAHGPQPGAYERSIGIDFFDELAVMVDTFRPLELGEGALACEDPGYAWTWSGRGPQSDR